MGQTLMRSQWWWWSSTQGEGDSGLACLVHMSRCSYSLQECLDPLPQECHTSSTQSVTCAGHLITLCLCVRPSVSSETYIVLPNKCDLLEDLPLVHVKANLGWEGKTLRALTCNLQSSKVMVIGG